VLDSGVLSGYGGKIKCIPMTSGQPIIGGPTNKKGRGEACIGGKSHGCEGGGGKVRTKRQSAGENSQDKTPQWLRGLQKWEGGQKTWGQVQTVSVGGRYFDEVDLKGARRREDQLTRQKKKFQSSSPSRRGEGNRVPVKRVQWGVKFQQKEGKTVSD